MHRRQQRVQAALGQAEHVRDLREPQAVDVSRELVEYL
jgi:hypothetical protein